MIEKCLDRFLIRPLLSRRCRDRPAPEGINPPRSNVVCICLGGIALLQRLSLIKVTVADAHESRGPLVLVSGVNAVERFFDVRRIKPDQWILPYFGAVNGLGFDFVDRPLAAFLSKNG